MDGDTVKYLIMNFLIDDTVRTLKKVFFSTSTHTCVYKIFERC